MQTSKSFKQNKFQEHSSISKKKYTAESLKENSTQSPLEKLMWEKCNNFLNN